MEAINYLKNEKYSSIDAVNEAVYETKKSQEETERSIQNKCTKRDRSLNQLTSIKEEYELMLRKNDIDSSETVIETVFLIESKSIEQKYDDKDMLDVSIANDALIYIGEYKKADDCIVKNLAFYTDEKLKQFIREYGNSLNQKIHNKFKNVINNDANSILAVYVQDLEKCLNELSSFSKFPSALECIDEKKKIESWRGKFNSYYRDLCIKMEQCKNSSDNLKLRKLLFLTQTLRFLDDFCEDGLRKTAFETLYKQYQLDLIKIYQETYKTVSEYVSKDDYARADAELFGIDVKFMEQKQ
jgi:hypothetical protein